MAPDIGNSGQLIAVDYHDDLKEVQGDPVLAALLRAPSARAPFDRIEWWRGLAQYCGLRPLLAVIRDGTQRGIMPLMRSGSQVRCLSNWYAFRVRPLFTPGADRPAMLAALARSLPAETAHLVLTPLPDEDGEATALTTALRGAGWTTFVEPCDVNHVLDVAARDFATYFAGRNGALRSTHARKAGKVCVRIETVFNPQSWQAYEEVYGQSWKSAEGSPLFLRNFASEEGAAGRLRLAIASIDDRPISAQFWTVEAGTAFIHKLAHVEDAKGLSPGTTLTAALLEHVIDQDRVALVDFGTGDDAYKRDWMEQTRPRYRIEAFRAARPGTWPRIARKVLQKVAAGGRHG